MRADTYHAKGVDQRVDRGVQRIVAATGSRELRVAVRLRMQTGRIESLYERERSVLDVDR